MKRALAALTLCALLGCQTQEALKGNPEAINSVLEDPFGVSTDIVEKIQRLADYQALEEVKIEAKVLDVQYGVIPYGQNIGLDEGLLNIDQYRLVILRTPETTLKLIDTVERAHVRGSAVEATYAPLAEPMSHSTYVSVFINPYTEKLFEALTPALSIETDGVLREVVVQ